MVRSPDFRKAQQWQRRMERFEASQRSVKRFCQDERVSVPSFYHWRKRLQQLAETPRDENSADVFMPVRVVTGSNVAVRLPGGTQLDVPTVDPQVLQLTVRTLAEVDAQRIAGGEAC